MSDLKTLLAGLVLAATPVLGSSVNAGPLADFAVCSGRLSAQLEHQWLLRDPDHERTERHLDLMADLLEAVTTDATASDALSLRIDAKHAHKLLLNRGTFSIDANDATWASRRAAQAVEACSSLLFGRRDQNGRV